MKNWLRIFALVLTAQAAVAEPQILLWPNGAEGAPEKMRINPPDEQVLTGNITPAITPFLPDPSKATGAAVIVIPGGGHKDIWITHEGYRVAQIMADHGVAAFVLRYRLSRAEGSTATLADSLADVQRAIRVVKSHASDWHLDPARVGVMGFSAGGHLTALAGSRSVEGNPAATDLIERLSAHPAFLGLIYAYLPDEIVFRADTPPSFFIFGDKDTVTTGEVQRYIELQKLGVPSEIHILSGVGHGFGIRPTNPPHVALWTTLFVNWLEASGMLKSH